ncbi:hypothetical protein C0991_008647 [Blastosporella zonata]|nr:hypothetical protein C0991_008647 [Blastosporella zonata]
MVSPQENVQLRNFAIGIQSDLGAFSAVSLSHGIFTLLFAFSTAIFVRRGLKTRASWVMFSVTLITYTISTMYWAADLAVIAYLLKYALIDKSDLELSARIRGARLAAFTVENVSLCASVLPPFISDAVVIWRAWVLFTDQRWIMILPISMVLGTTATSLVYVSSAVSGSLSGQINSRLFGSSIILSTATNVVTTLMITYKLWCHRKCVVKNLGTSPRSPAQKVLDILVESGFVYCALQVITLTLDSLPKAPELGTPYAYAVQVFLCSYTVIAAMYPTIVIVLVNSQRSFVETYGFSDAGISAQPDSQYRPATAGHLSFAAGPQTEITSITGAESVKRHVTSTEF